MYTAIGKFLYDVKEFFNGISNTVWGILVLLLAMHQYSGGATESAFYFAGVASTLLGLGKNPAAMPLVPTTAVTETTTHVESTNA